MEDSRIETLTNALSKLPDQESQMLSMLVAMVLTLEDIRVELKAIRLATEQANEPGPDDEPSPFQSLNG